MWVSALLNSPGCERQVAGRGLAPLVCRGWALEQDEGANVRACRFVELTGMRTAGSRAWFGTTCLSGVGPRTG